MCGLTGCGVGHIYNMWVGYASQIETDGGVERGPFFLLNGKKTSCKARPILCAVTIKVSYVELPKMMFSAPVVHTHRESKPMGRGGGVERG